MVRTWVLLTLGAAAGLPAQGPGFILPMKVQDMWAAAQRDSNDPAVHYNLGLGYWNGELYENADSQFRMAIRLDADFAPAYLALFAMAYARWPELWKEDPKLPPDIQSKREEADRFAEHAFVSDPLVDLTPLSAALPPVPAVVYSDPRIARLWDRLERWYYELCRGDYRSAYTHLEQQIAGAASRNRVPLFILWHHGIAAAHLGLDSIAELDFQTLADRVDSTQDRNAILHFPIGAADYDYVLASLMIRRGQAPGAVRYLHAALVANAGLYQAHTLLATVAEAGQDWDDAIAERRAAIDVDPGNSRLLTYLGATLMSAGRDSEAEAPLRQAVSLDARDFRAAFVLGVDEMHLGKKADARNALTAAIALTPSRYAGVLEDAKRRLTSLTQ